MSLFAFHIPDMFLTAPWWIGGFVVAGFLCAFAAWRIRDEEIPQIALLTAAFFVASLIHVPVPAGPRAHLVLNGLLGIILGRRAPLAVLVGLFLQAALFGHGGFTSLGVNTCVMALPALLSWLLFSGLRRISWLVHPWFRALLVAGSVLILAVSLIYSLTLLFSNRVAEVESLDVSWANSITFHPLTLGALALLAGLAAWVERRLENAPEFALGLLLGELSVLATLLLNCLALVYGGPGDIHTLVLVTIVVHLPLAVVEGIILGFTLGFLARVKPEMIGWHPPEKTACPVESLP
jgi:cobalt/nickel transport system permease protein